MGNIIELNNIKKTFKDKTLFQHFNLTIPNKSFFGIVGKSGSGKTTLLNIIGLIEPIDEGEIRIDGETYKHPNSKQSLLLRRHKVGYLFQNFGLADDETVKWNLALALAYKKLNKKEKAQKIDAMLQKFNLSSLKNKRIYQLSGGEQQRVAIMRLMLQNPEIIIADEPTSSLDSMNEQLIMSYLQELHEQGKTIIIVTHNQNLKSYFTNHYDLTGDSANLK